PGRRDRLGRAAHGPAQGGRLLRGLGLRRQGRGRAQRDDGRLRARRDRLRAERRADAGGEAGPAPARRARAGDLLRDRDRALPALLARRARARGDPGLAAAAPEGRGVVSFRPLLMPLALLLFGVGAASADRHADRLAGLLELRPGMVVAEIGAGVGKTTRAVAERVGPSGHVYSTEIDPEALAKIRETVADLSNVTVVQAGVAETGLPDACCDAIFMEAVYHH